MSTYKVIGPAKLSGKVSIQGAKNSAMRYIIVPLLTNDVSEFSNIPDISSTHNLAELVSIQGGIINWKSKNCIQIDTKAIKKPVKIPQELFYHTSGAIYLNTFLTAKYGYCEIEIDIGRNDTGGDQIGRKLPQKNDFLESIGITVKSEKNILRFVLKNNKAFTVSVPETGNFGNSHAAVVSALFKDGTSIIKNTSQVAEFDDFIELLVQMGAQLQKEGDRLIIEGNHKLKGINRECMYDKHDFFTFFSAALTTESSIIIQNVNYKSLKLDCLENFIKQLGANVIFQNNSCVIEKNKINNLKPITIIAREYPQFITEWQVLISPLLAKIKGESSVVEAYHTNRMHHWEQLAKMGATYDFFKDPDYPEDENNNPRAVKIHGLSTLNGANVSSEDVRGGAAMIIAGLAANGKTVISDPQDHIKRGYENLVLRLNNLGSEIEEKEE